MSDVKEITKDNFDTEVLSATGKQLVYYYAPWCKPCKEMDEVIDLAAGELSEKISVGKVNTDQEGEIIAQQKIRVVPSCQVFNEGKVLDTFRGGMTKLELLSQLSNFILQDESADNSEENPKENTEEADKDSETKTEDA